MVYITSSEVFLTVFVQKILLPLFPSCSGEFLPYLTYETASRGVNILPLASVEGSSRGTDSQDMEQPDYSRYLQSIYQDTTWEVERTPHGSINATLRARKTDGQNGPASLVLKHASPYFEDEGSLHPFSLHRQVR